MYRKSVMLRSLSCSALYPIGFRAEATRSLIELPEGRGCDSRWCHWHNPSGRTVALGSSQPLTEMITRNISGGKGGRCVWLTTLSHSCADCLEIWEYHPPGTLRACPSNYRDDLPLPLPWKLASLNLRVITDSILKKKTELFIFCNFSK